LLLRSRSLQPAPPAMPSVACQIMPNNLSAQDPAASEPEAEAASDANESRFLAALQRMMGGAELSDEGVRHAIGKLTPKQRQELIAEGQGLKRDLLTKAEHSSERSLYFQEVNRTADHAGMPVDKDGLFLAKKISAFMETSSDKVPMIFLLEALASCPYLVKAAVTEAQGGAAGASAADLAEIETALTLLKADGWREGELSTRPPFVRRNLLLLQSHMHRERLRALALAPATSAASTETVDKARRLLDMLLAYCLQVGWVKACLAITELQGLLTNGLWHHEDDECRAHMKQKLGVVGLKLPRVSVQCHASDVAPGEKVMLQVTLNRMHAHTPEELEEYLRAARDEQQTDQQAAVCEAPPPPPPTAPSADDGDAKDLAAAFGGEAAALGKEGWWLICESLRDVPRLRASGMATKEPMHNAMVGRQALSPSLADPQWCADIEFEAPSTPGEYKVVVHVRSSSMISVDCRRKVAFQVRSSLSKRSLPSSSSGTSTEPAETVEEMELRIAEMQRDEVALEIAAGAQQGAVPEERPTEDAAAPVKPGPTTADAATSTIELQ